MRHVFGCERQQIMKGKRLWFLEFLWANVTSCPEWTNSGRDNSNIDTEAPALSVDRVLNFFPVENSLFQEYFLLLFFSHRWTFESQKLNVPLQGSS